MEHGACYPGLEGARKRKNYWILPKPWSIPAGKSRLKVRKSVIFIASERGWGEVGAMSYGTFLPWLQEALNDNQTMLKNKTSKNGSLTCVRGCWINIGGRNGRVT
jgi:hypothetical protein